MTKVTKAVLVPAADRCAIVLTPAGRALAFTANRLAGEAE
jgi:hypothetical protein